MNHTRACIIGAAAVLLSVARADAGAKEPVTWSTRWDAQAERLYTICPDSGKNADIFRGVAAVLWELRAIHHRAPGRTIGQERRGR